MRPDREGMGRDGGTGGGNGEDPPPARPVVEDPEGNVPGGPFPSWGALYATILVYAGLWVLLLWVLTATLTPDLPGGRP